MYDLGYSLAYSLAGTFSSGFFYTSGTYGGGLAGVEVYAASSTTSSIARLALGLI